MLTPHILRLNIAGQPVEWLSWQEATCLYARELVAWTLGERVRTVHGGFSRLTGLQSTIDLHSIIACSGHVAWKPRLVPPLTNRALFRRDRHLCMYCALKLPERELTRDHIVPRSRGARPVDQRGRGLQALQPAQGQPAAGRSLHGDDRDPVPAEHGRMAGTDQQRPHPRRPDGVPARPVLAALALELIAPARGVHNSVHDPVQLDPHAFDPHPEHRDLAAVAALAVAGEFETERAADA